MQSFQKHFILNTPAFYSYLIVEQRRHKKKVISIRMNLQMVHVPLHAMTMISIVQGLFQQFWE